VLFGHDFDLFLDTFDASHHYLELFG